MILERLTIENYRSIDTLDFEVEEVNGSKTYALLGINESGKSSFLKALSLIDGGDINFPLNYFHNSKPVVIKQYYKVDPTEIKELHFATVHF